MGFTRHSLSRLWRRFRQDEAGGPTIEFALVFPGIIMLLVSSMELGLLLTRHVMMERGLDMAVRELRLNNVELDPDDPSESARRVKVLVCNAAGLLPNCMVNLRLEMRPIDLFFSGSNQSNNAIPRAASCTDYDEPFLPARNFAPGTSNQVMVVRACGSFAPMFPNIVLGAALATGPHGRYRIVSSTAFVMEPVS